MSHKAKVVASIRPRVFIVLALTAAVNWFWPLSARASCGCSSMTASTSGTTGTMCSDRDLDFPECTKSTGSSKGCSTLFAYDCPLGVNSEDYGASEPSQKSGFLPVATLTSGSTPGDCTTGQILQETILSGTTTEANPKINPTSLSGAQTLGGQQIEIDNDSSHEFPLVGATSGSKPLYGGDDYRLTDAAVLMSLTSSAISWWDNPDQTKDTQSEAATWRFAFIAFVLGSGSSASSCMCAFEITVDWPSNSNTPSTSYGTLVCSTW